MTDQKHHNETVGAHGFSFVCPNCDGLYEFAPFTLRCLVIDTVAAHEADHPVEEAERTVGLR